MAQVVVYDACVLYPSTLRDVLIRVGLSGLCQPKWSHLILDEVFRNLRTNRPDLDQTRLARTRQLMNDSIRDVIVTGDEDILQGISLPDPDDRHVVAAAMNAQATHIITKNLRDFPSDALSTVGITAQHPDDFLTNFLDADPHALDSVISAIAHARTRSQSAEDDVLESLAIEAPRTVARIRHLWQSHVD
ncbi:PIN domain-containing protein [Nesterenkonia aerolata]|uniref:PIN domain-containing protein n=1 Tax=Nesterenkonia aerolata TaxID=3074079 RepID=A0ABU2DQT8_9MICC|nr:PIN domain-containing protein [Nesterenkonia sp. LY-0111]MDR8018833.1 PIN domain-containing protein [Nesterenkonia sp. LY-0111]